MLSLYNAKVIIFIILSNIGDEFMFCEKCGNKLSEGDAFCEKCGAPVPQENPVTTEDNGVNQNNQQFTQPVNFDNNANVTEGVQQAAQPYQVQSQPKVKKPFPTKLVVICGAAAVVIAGIIITLCTLIPYLNRIKLDDYIKVEFDKGSLYNGYASADIYIDSDTIEKEKVSDDKKSDIDYGKYADNISKGDWQSVLSDAVDDYSASQASVSSILDYCNVKAYLKDAKTESTTEDSDSFYTVSSATINNISKDDTIVVELKWDDSESAKKYISEYEKTLGIQFDKSDVKKELKVSDILKEKKISLKDMVEVDIIKHIVDNNLIKTYGIKDGDLSIDIAKFDYKVDDYKLKYESGSTISVYDKNDDFVDYFYLNVDGSESYLDEGDKVTFKTEQEIITDTPLIIKDSSTTVTAKANKVMTSDEAKANVDKINSAVNDYIDEYYSSLTSYSPVEMYYVQPKKASDDEQAFILVVEKGKYDGWFNSYDTYYCGIYIKNPYLLDDEVYSSSIDSSSGDQKLADYKKYESFLNSKNYTATKIS
ncbi:zinc ribbon domain-containing protein [Ruminococcus sp. AM36-18]|jgi:hypothetical protein|nr:zinc ribbon domain-containing protein [Ruminococcus sp. AM36-18]